ncbi:spermatogenesis-associated protein 17-like [Schistocerca gregaria]|uniref:spermatogenesis-associated protein 17-like n=1 Tax=Schistocerca gregaria TaxID=7010 RepID=UPI00211E6305|nr:spermatogenesis-associated protein 17-like [Schistocerca gregaria]
MASVFPYIQDASAIYKEIQKREDEAEENRRAEYVSALTIQKTVRGFLERQHIRRLNAAAVTIQRHWRGYVGRKLYMLLLQKAVNDMYWQHYCTSATQIQKIWRGYVVRTRIFNYYEFKARVKEAVEKDAELLEKMQQNNHRFETAVMDVLENEAKQWVLFILFKLHHLMRTTNQRGIYSKNTGTELSAIEKQLKSLSYTKYVKLLRAQRKQASKMISSSLALKYGIDYGKEIEKLHNTSVIRQGKYEDPSNRIKCAQPKVSRFSFPRVRYNDNHLIMKQAQYQPVKFNLRETDPAKNVCDNEFVNILRPIEVFDKIKVYDKDSFCPLTCALEIFLKRCNSSSL